MIHRWAWSDPQGGVDVVGGGQNRFSKNLIFKRFAAKFFPKVSRRFPEGQKWTVNLTFNAFLHRNFSSKVHYGSRGS